MNTINDKDLGQFIESSPLYTKTKYLEGLPINSGFDLPDSITVRTAYKFFCPAEKDVHTFRLENHMSYQDRYTLSIATMDVFGNGYNTKKVDWSFHVVGVCQSCGYQANFLLNLFTEEDLDIKKSTWPTIFIRKFGQYPPLERTPGKEVEAYLTAEDKENYQKALSNLNVSNGIGAFAYLRRIIENEIKRIVEDISKLEFDDVEHIRKAWQVYLQNHQMNTLIETINPYLPKSLLETTGDNPIKLLHQQLSEGLHKLSEEECLSRAKQIDTVLRFVIKKVNSEKTDLKVVREAMKGLRN